MPRSVPLLLALLLALLPAMAAPVAARAQPPMLESPLRCVNGQDCFIQNYLDHDPGPGVRDYACGPLGYDGHTGTDFRVLDPEALRAGIPVLAAAPGVVRAVREGEEDARPGRQPDITGREAGNAVALDHGDGWETQYSHLRQGSIRVAPGQKVEAGRVLGLVGLSGRTQFPHVELAVRHDGKPVDPFRGLAGGPDCGPGKAPLWSPEALAALAYAPSALAGAGFAAQPPDQAALSAEGPEVDRLTVLAPALVFWVRALGVRAGDELSLRLTGPDGTVLAEHAAPLDRNQAQRLVYIGKRRRVAPWPVGTYTGEFSLARSNGTGKRTTVLETVRILEIR